MPAQIVVAHSQSSPSLTPNNTDVSRRLARKQLGAFYTPISLSDVLVDWAVRTSSDTILEPGFGGCGFIESALRRLENLSSDYPASQLFGCDIDDAAFGVLRKTLPELVIDTNFPKKDFLACVPEQTWHQKFSCAVGNPPYVAYQTLDAEARSKYQFVLRQRGFQDVSARASLWAYFVLHATSFLVAGGRLAWVLPGSCLQAHYAKPVRAHLARLFGRVFTARVHERLFVTAGADEETVVLLAEDFQAPECGREVIHAHVGTVASLRDAVAKWQGESTRHKSTGSKSIANEWPKSTSPIPTKTVGDIVRVKIGLVTGDNPYFVLSTAEARARGLNTRSLHPILSKFSMIYGVALTSEDFERAIGTGARGWLVTAPSLPCRSKSLTEYLGAYPDEKLSTVSTFKKRSLWHAIADGRVPEAFWPVMRDKGPTLVLNNARINCTNTIHRVYLQAGAAESDLLMLVLGVASTFGQLSAEVVGRHYGSGVLKHEPREAEAIRVPWVANAKNANLVAAVAEMDSRLRSGSPELARRTADEFFMRHIQGYTAQFVRTLERDLRVARAIRTPPTRGTNSTRNLPKRGSRTFRETHQDSP